MDAKEEWSPSPTSSARESVINFSKSLSDMKILIINIAKNTKNEDCITFDRKDK